MRVLFVNGSGAMGGAEHSLLLLIESMVCRDSRFEPCVVLLEDGPFRDALAARGISTMLYEMPPPLRRLTRLYRSYELLAYFRAALSSRGIVRGLRFEIRGRRPSIVHTNGTKAHVLGGIAAKAEHLPSVWHVRDIFPARLRGPYAAAARLLATAVVVNSDATGAQFRGRLGPRLRRVYNPIDTARFHPVARTGNTWPIVGMIAHLTPWKGHEVFLRMAALLVRSLPELRCLIVGGDVYHTDGHSGYGQRLRTLARALGIQHTVRFLPYTPDVSTVMADMDIVVHPPVLPEPFGRVVAEAMAMGKCVVASAVGGIPEIVSDGETGILVPPGDAEALARCVGELIRQPARRATIGERARATIVARFGVDRHAAEVEAVYRDVLEHANPTSLQRFLSPSSWGH